MNASTVALTAVNPAAQRPVLSVGNAVRPVVALAGLDARLIYRVAEVVGPNAFGYTLAYLIDPVTGALVTVENAQLILERVDATPTMRPTAALPV